MPTLDFKGKTFVLNHHLSVPYHQLLPKKDLSLTDKVSLHDNLIIHGDNLLALKALLPTYAGKIKCIYIDPPYNTGNEKWIYNDNVNSPMITEWLGKVVDKEDMTRHDKWLCMMMPRLRLFKELLSKDGIIFISIDDNEINHLRTLMDEIFDENNFIQEIIWKNKYGPGAMTKTFGNVHEYILCYSKNPIKSIESSLSDEEIKNYNKKDNKFHIKGGYITQPLMTRSKDDRANLVYPIKYGNEEIMPDKQWIWEKERLLKAIKDDEVVFNKNEKDNKWSVRFKQYLKDENGIIRKGKPISIFNGPFNQEGTWEIETIFGDKTIFNNPKPTALVEKLLSFVINNDETKDYIVLDSCGGSGATAHAVLHLNKEDGGNRKFILIECEDYANDITAERVRRVIKGVKTAKDENLKEGLGGTFSFFELGNAIEMESILKGKSLPSYQEFARYLFFTSTGEEFDESKIDEQSNYIGTSKSFDVFLFYKPDLNYLKSTALNINIAKNLKLPDVKSNRKKLVFAPAKYLDNNTLNDLNIEFCQLPYEIYRLKG
jgi:adenine-specific DNA-methyltransferase